MTARATPCCLCFDPVPFGTLAWLRHKGRDPETGRPLVFVVCDECKERGQ